jgi:hypothetical protein
MAVSALLASLLMAQSAPATTVDVAYDDLIAGKAAAAIDKIEHSDARAQNHVAAFINLGIAYARVGRTTDARAMFEAAANSDERYRLETATGEWMDSRDLARRALAMLEKGAFSSTQFAAR